MAFQRDVFVAYNIRNSSVSDQPMKDFSPLYHKEFGSSRLRSIESSTNKLPRQCMNRNSNYKVTGISNSVALKL